jgi:AP-2 complex subunit alpha
MVVFAMRDIFKQLIGFGTSLLEGIDTIPDNYVCAGIIQTRTMQIGVLMRIEPNKQAQVWR